MTFVAHISVSLRYGTPGAHSAVEEFPPSQFPDKKPPDSNPPDPRKTFLSKPAAVVQRPVASPEYERLDGNAKATEPSKDWRGMADLFDIDEDSCRKKVFALLQRN